MISAAAASANEPARSTAKSRVLNLEARRYLPGGVARTGAFGLPYPIYCESGSGAMVRDLDGNSYVDFNNCFTALIHGHSHPSIVGAIGEQLELGTCFGGPTVREVELARQICLRSPAFESVRFVNSGSEAVMTAIKAARAWTGRRLIAKCRGAYHGSYDHMEVSVGLDCLGESASDARDMLAHQGVSAAAVSEVVLIDFNDVDATRLALQDRGRELAAIIFDPVPNYAGLIPITPAYLRLLRELTHETGALLIADEIVNLRQSFGGALERYGISADLYCLGKIIGGGTSIGAVCGNREVMSMFDPSNGKPPVIQSGTFSGNPLSMAAGVAALRMLTGDAIRTLNELGGYARAALAASLEHAPFATCVTGAGSLFRLHFKAGPIRLPRDARTTATQAERCRRFMALLQNAGFLLTSQGLGSLSTPMSRRDIDDLVAAVAAVVTHDSLRA